MGENAGLNTDPLKDTLSYAGLLMYTDVITVESLVLFFPNYSSDNCDML